MLWHCDQHLRNKQTVLSPLFLRPLQKAEQMPLTPSSRAFRSRVLLHRWLARSAPWPGGMLAASGDCQFPQAPFAGKNSCSHEWSRSQWQAASVPSTVNTLYANLPCWWAHPSWGLELSQTTGFSPNLSTSLMAWPGPIHNQGPVARSACWT